MPGESILTSSDNTSDCDDGLQFTRLGRTPTEAPRANDRTSKVPMVIALLALIVSLANSSRVGDSMGLESNVQQLHERLEEQSLDIQYLTDELQRMSDELQRLNSKVTVAKPVAVNN